MSAFVEVSSTTNGGLEGVESRREPWVGLDLDRLENRVMTGAYLSSNEERVAL